MPIAVIMPKFEMSQETGKVARWLKDEGAHVEKGEVILEVETDKLSMEVEAKAGGRLVGISAAAGEVVPIGQPIAYIIVPGESWSPGAPVGQPTPEAAASAGPAPADAATGLRASPLAERMAAEHGLDLRLVPGTGPSGRITREDVEAQFALQVAAGSGQGAGQAHSVRAVPAARRLARESGIDLAAITGTGPDGRIQSADVALAVRASVTQPASHEVPLAAPVVAPATGGRPAVRRVVPLTSIRRTIAERMTQSVREAPQFTVSVDVDMGRAMAMVQDFRIGTEAQQGPKVTVTALLVKACAWALTQFPGANAMFQFDPAAPATGPSIIEWDEVNVGVATAIDQGLIVPVVHGADRLGMKGIATRLADLTARAREGRLKLDDLQGGTFTISNLGMFGIDRFTAIINPPQAAILAVGRVAKRAVIREDDRVAVCQMASFALTADHRVLDGAGAAQFLATIQRALEYPGLLLG